MTIGLSQAAVSASRTSGSSVHLAFDYAGALALIDVLGRETISSGEIDRLLEIHGLAAMVDNVTRFIPTITRSHFRHDLQTFVETGEEPRHDGYRVWGFQQIWDTRIQVGEWEGVADYVTDPRRSKATGPYIDMPTVPGLSYWT